VCILVFSDIGSVRFAISGTSTVLQAGRTRLRVYRDSDRCGFDCLVTLTYSFQSIRSLNVRGRAPFGVSVPRLLFILECEDEDVEPFSFAGSRPTRRY